MSGPKRHVIIGNSAAALAAIRGIRQAGDAGEVTLIGAEPCYAYSPVLTTYYIEGSIRREQMFLTGGTFYRRMNVRPLLGRKALQIDPENHYVRLGDRSRVRYDDLLLACGASARGLENVDPDAREFVTSLRTLSDADRIVKAVAGAKEIVFVGAGLVSLQTIRAVLGRGIRITLLVGSHQILSQQLDGRAAGLIQRRLEKAGVSILFGRRVEGVRRHGDRAQVVTGHGERLAADLVFVGKGVRPNVDLAKEAGIRVRTGVVVDARMRTNLQDIYAAGDVAEGQNGITGTSEVIATWFNAGAQGEIAGRNMAGRPASRRGQFRENVTTILGLAAVSMGISRAADEPCKELLYVNEEAGEYRRFLLQDSRIVGALLLGRIEDAGVIRHCIAQGKDISSWEHRLAAAPLHYGRILLGRGFNLPFFGA